MQMQRRRNRVPHIIGADPSPVITVLVVCGCILAVLVLWHGLVATDVIPERKVPLPGAVATLWWDLAWDGQWSNVNQTRVYLHDHVLASLWRVLPWLAGAAAGFPVAIMLGMLPWARYSAVLLVGAVYGMSATVVIVLLQHWFGYAAIPKMGASAWVGFGIPLIVVYWRWYGMLYHADPENARWQPLFDYLQLIGVGRWRLFWDHAVPMLRGEFLVALLASGVIAWKLLTFSELTGAYYGLGRLVVRGRELADPELIFVGALTLLAMVLVTWAAVVLVFHLVWPDRRRRLRVRR